MIKSMILNVRYVKLMQIQQEALEKLSVFSAKVRAENTRFMRGRTGTGYQMDICLADDMQITRDNHCSIVYDVNKHKFTIVPTAGSLTYVNDVLLKQPRLLYEKDVFRIGRSNYKLVKKKN